MRKGTWVLLLLMTACLLGGCADTWLGLHGIGACQNAADL